MKKHKRSTQEIEDQKRKRADRLFKQLEDTLSEDKVFEKGSIVEELAIAALNFSSSFKDLRYKAVCHMNALLIQTKPWKHKKLSEDCKKKFIEISKTYFHLGSRRLKKKKSPQIDLFQK